MLVLLLFAVLRAALRFTGRPWNPSAISIAACKLNFTHQPANPATKSRSVAEVGFSILFYTLLHFMRFASQESMYNTCTAKTQCKQECKVRVRIVNAEDAGCLVTETGAGSLTGYTLQRGNELVSCDEVLIMETDADSLEECFEIWKQCAQAGEEGYAYWVTES